MALWGLVLAACGNYSPEDQAFLLALPRLADVAFQPPGAELDDDDNTSTASGQIEQALSSCAEAPLRCEAQKTAQTFNELTAGILKVVDAVISQTEFTRYKNRRVWGPHYIADPAQSDDPTKGLTVRFELERVEAEDALHPFRWCLHAARGKNDQWQWRDALTCDLETDSAGELSRILLGQLTPGEERDVRAGSGAGQLELDGHRLAALLPEDGSIPQARFDIVFDHLAGSELIDLTISEVIDERSGLFTSGAYHFSRLADKSGDFSFTIKLDVNGQEEGADSSIELETFEILAQWNSERAGAARAAIYGGDLGLTSDGTAVRWDVSECWDRALNTVYLEHPDQSVPNIGTAGSCEVPIPDAL